ncbi:hypothetical protein [Otoolea muris]|nr:hypothetical protein [Otoolea muris]
MMKKGCCQQSFFQVSHIEEMSKEGKQAVFAFGHGNYVVLI